MLQMLMITLKYICLYFLARFNSIICYKMKYFKKYKIGLLHLASTNPFSLSQKIRFYNWIKINNLNPSCLITLYNIRIILYYIFCFIFQVRCRLLKCSHSVPKYSRMCRSNYQLHFTGNVWKYNFNSEKQQTRLLNSPQLRKMFCSTHLKLLTFLHYLTIL